MEQSARPPRRLVVVLLTVVLLAAAGVTAYLTGVFDDEGRFRGAPPPCATLEPSLPRLGATYVPKQDGDNCELWQDDALKLTVAYTAVTPTRGDAPSAAGSRLRDFAELGFAERSGLADEAYARDESLYFRVSNLLVGVTVAPGVAAPPAGIQAFARDLAERLS